MADYTKMSLQRSLVRTRRTPDFNEDLMLVNDQEKLTKRTKCNRSSHTGFDISVDDIDSGHDLDEAEVLDEGSCRQPKISSTPSALFI